MPGRVRLVLAAAGALGAALWAAQQPLDKRAFGTDYDDVELLGMAVPTTRWRAAGWAAHLANGAAFGVVYSELARRTPRVRPLASAQALAQAENVALYPLAALVDRYHPARATLAPAFGARQFAQATWRHAILGAVLGAAAELALAHQRTTR